MSPRESPFWEPDPNLRKAEDAAARTLAYCRRQLRVKKPPTPVPIELWIESPLGLRLSVTNLRTPELASTGIEIEGATNPQDCEILIDQSISDDDPRFRFACAHELGHFVLHFEARHVFHEITHAGELYLDMYEGQADRFAEAILMPATVVLASVGALSRTRGLPTEETIQDLIQGDERGCRFIEENLLALAGRFVVPTRALAFRLLSFRFRDGQYLLAGKVRESLMSQISEEAAAQ